MVLLSHPTANNFVRSLVIELHKRNLLYKFCTSLAVFPDSLGYKLSNIGSLKELKRRSLPKELEAYTETWPMKEMGRLLSQKMKWNSLIQHESGLFSVDKIYQNCDQKTAALLPDAVKNGVTHAYAYEDGALNIFQEGKRLGIKNIYDLPIAYWAYGSQLMEEEALRLPEWKVTLGGGVSDSKEKRDRKIEELSLSDLVIVPSNFVKNSLPEWSNTKPTTIAPFGTPYTSSKEIKRTYSQKGQRLRVLFVGSMGQRKGLGDLFAAVKLLNSPEIELVTLGSPQTDLSFYKRQLSDFTYEYGRSNSEVLELMRTCDVFCLPSIVEGRALVMQEAMSQGLPVILTPNTGGEDLVDDDTGFLVPIRSPEIIAEKLQWFLDNRDEIPKMGIAARNKALAYSWENYNSLIINAILGL